MAPQQATPTRNPMRTPSVVTFDIDYINDNNPFPTPKDFIVEPCRTSTPDGNSDCDWYCFWFAYNTSIARGINPGPFRWYGKNIRKYGATISDIPIPNTAGYVFFYHGNPDTTEAGHVQYYERKSGAQYIMWRTTGRMLPQAIYQTADRIPEKTYGYSYFRFVPLSELQ